MQIMRVLYFVSSPETTNSFGEQGPPSIPCGPQKNKTAIRKRVNPEAPFARQAPTAALL